ncbi:MAG: pilus assembly protein TadG-related protein [Sulfitobacter sp.]
MKSNSDRVMMAQRHFQAMLIRFARQEDGIVTVFACFIILIMLMVGGIGVDLMRNEMERVKIQNTVDRAVLAAADLDQTLDPEAVVRDYLAKSNMSDYVGHVTIDEGLNYRTACVDTAPSATPTLYMRLLNVDELPLYAKSCAEERIAKVEISLVLDISGSMDNDNKLETLQDAAGIFIDTVIRDETQDLISISLVPYSEHVNPGKAIFDQLNVNQQHTFSWCLEMDDSDFDTTTLDRSKTYNQMQHYQFNYSSSNSRTDTVCPRYDGPDNDGWDDDALDETITPFSQNATALKDKINDLKPRAGTSIFLGMKWAAAMLDPDFRTITQSLSNSGIVDATFASRPSAWYDDETLKTVILMTDGKNDKSWRLDSDVYTRQDHISHWNNYNYYYYMNSIRRSYTYWASQKYTASIGDRLLQNVCDAAKGKGIVIWSIGFEVDDHGAEEMRECASSNSHFFRVEGVDLADAFRAIARQINQLRLTQ